MSLLIVLTSVKRSSAKSYKRVRIHVPVKVKHHHHTHTVYKHVHHAVPIHYDHHDVHVVHPETEEIESDYYIPPGRGHEYIDDIGGYSESDYDRSGEQSSYERYRKKRSKKKFKLFNNNVIGWKGRSDFDKIASEYLSSLKKQKIPDNDYREHLDYDDDEAKKKR